MSSKLNEWIAFLVKKVPRQHLTTVFQVIDLVGREHDGWGFQACVTEDAVISLEWWDHGKNYGLSVEVPGEDCGVDATWWFYGPRVRLWGCEGDWDHDLGHMINVRKME